MRLALYYPWVYLKGGAERTILALMSKSRHEWTLFTNHYDPESTFPEFHGHDVVELTRISVRRSVLHAGHAAQTLLTQQLPLDDHQALMVVTESLGNLATVRSNSRPLFCLCLTPLRVAYDPAIREHFQSSANVLTRSAVNLFKIADRALWGRYRRVFAISEEVRSRLLNAGLVDADGLEVARPGVDVDLFSKRLPTEPLFLLPGRIMWTKQIELGIDAFVELKQTTPAAAPFKLVVAGMVDRKSRPYLQSLRERAAHLGSDVEFIECPSDAELKDLYGRSYATLFTAYNEDWGLVPLESMAAGKPVVAVDRGGPRETVLHEETGLLVNPSPGAFAGAMARLISQPAWAQTLGSAGQRRAAEFPWSTFVDCIDDGIERELAEKATSTPAPALARRVAAHAVPSSFFDGFPSSDVSPRLWVYTNYDCNLSCSYCVARSSPRAERRAIDLETFHQLVEEAAALGVRELFLTGGEPFLLPDIYERIIFATDRVPTTVLTNGMLFSGWRAERLPDLRGRRVAFQVTLDGPDEPSHESYRGKGSWQKAVRGIRQLVAEGLTVYVGSTETSANSGRLHELRKFVSELGIPAENHHIRPLARRGQSDQGLDLTAESLTPELTVNRDGVFWHPFGTDDDLLLTRRIFPLRDAYQLLLDRYQAILADGSVPQRYRCAVV